MDLALPVQHQAALIAAFGIDQLKIGPVPTPQHLGPTEVLVRVAYSGVCHTDLHVLEGDFPGVRMPVVAGHEGAGVVVRVGSCVNAVSVGDRVGIKWLQSTCNKPTCEFCTSGRENVCPLALFSGYTADGSHQEYAKTVDAAQLAVIPDVLGLREAAPIMCAGVTIYTALKQSDCRPGQWVTLSGGAGGLGHLGIQYARAMGFRVVVIDGGDEKMKLCLELGAEEYVDYLGKLDVAQEICRITNGGSHGVIVLAPSKVAFEQAPTYTRACGTVVAVGLPRESFPMAIFPLVTKAITIKGSYIGNRRDTKEALDFAARKQVRCESTIETLDKLPEIYRAMKANALTGRVVLDLGGESVEKLAKRSEGAKTEEVHA